MRLSFCHDINISIPLVDPSAFKMMMIHPICKAQAKSASDQGAHEGIAWSHARTPRRPLLSRRVAKWTFQSTEVQKRCQKKFKVHSKFVSSWRTPFFISNRETTIVCLLWPMAIWNFTHLSPSHWDQWDHDSKWKPCKFIELCHIC